VIEQLPDVIVPAAALAFGRETNESKEITSKKMSNPLPNLLRLTIRTESEITILKFS
jgi:hypothetical protein